MLPSILHHSPKANWVVMVPYFSHHFYALKALVLWSALGPPNQSVPSKSKRLILKKFYFECSNITRKEKKGFTPLENLEFTKQSIKEDFKIEAEIILRIARPYPVWMKAKNQYFWEHWFKSLVSLQWNHRKSWQAWMICMDSELCLIFAFLRLELFLTLLKDILRTTSM